MCFCKPTQLLIVKRIGVTTKQLLGVIATPGRQKRRAEPLLTESVLNPYVLIPLPYLYYYPRFYHLKFVEEEAENFTPLSKIKHLLTLPTLSTMHFT